MNYHSTNLNWTDIHTTESFNLKPVPNNHQSIRYNNSDNKLFSFINHYTTDNNTNLNTITNRKNVTSNNSSMNNSNLTLSIGSDDLCPLEIDRKLSTFMNEVNECSNDTAVVAAASAPAVAVAAAAAAAAALNGDYSPNYYHYYLQNQHDHLNSQQQQQHHHQQQMDLIQNTNANFLNSSAVLDLQHMNVLTQTSLQQQQQQQNSHQSGRTNRLNESNNISDLNNLSIDDINGRSETNLMKTGMLCLICEDKATGKHYGAYSCDGCKGFFRRSVRRNHSYTCRHKRCCIVTKDKRNQCRFCRLRKCFRVGMKKSAVQNERDKISNRPIVYDSNSGVNSILNLEQLLQAENVAHCVIQQNYSDQFKNCNCYSTFTQSNDSKQCLDNCELTNRLANVHDICDSIRTQLIFLIEWAKNLPSFTALSMNDQIALLQSHAGEMLILGAVWRSMSSTTTCQSNTSHVLNNTSEYNNQNNNNNNNNNNNTNSGLNNHNNAQCLRATWMNKDSVTNSTNTISTSGTTINPTTTTTTTTTTSSSSTNIDSSSMETCIVLNDNIRTNERLDKENEIKIDLTDEPQLILLGNSRIISRRSPQPEIAEIASLVFDQLYQPMLDLCLEETEIACLRAIIFFDPNCSSLSEHGRMVTRSCQYQVQLELMNLMNDKLYLPQGRFGALLLLLPDLRSITDRMVCKLQIARQMGLTRFDGLLSEILLGSAAAEATRMSSTIQTHPNSKTSSSFKCYSKSNNQNNNTNTNNNIMDDKHSMHNINNKLIHSMPKLYSTHTPTTTNSSSSIYSSTNDMNITSHNLNQTRSQTSRRTNYNNNNNNNNGNNLHNHNHYNNQLVQSKLSMMNDNTNDNIDVDNIRSGINDTSVTTQLEPILTEPNNVSNVFQPFFGSNQNPMQQAIYLANNFDGNYDSSTFGSVSNSNNGNYGAIRRSSMFDYCNPQLSNAVRKFGGTDITNPALFTMHLAQENFENLPTMDYATGNLSNVNNTNPNNLDDNTECYSDNQYYSNYVTTLNPMNIRSNQLNSINNGQLEQNIDLVPQLISNMFAVEHNSS